MWDVLHSARCIVMAAVNRFGKEAGSPIDAVMAGGVIYADIAGTQYKITVEKA